MVVKQKLRGLQAASKAKKQTKQLELQVVALGGRVAELEQAAAAQGVLCREKDMAATDLLKGKEKAWERLSSTAAAKLAESQKEIADLRNALAARCSSAIQANSVAAVQTKVAREERGKRVEQEARIAGLDAELEQCKCGKGTWNEPPEGKAGSSYRCKQRGAIRKAGLSFFADKGSYSKRIAEEAVLNKDVLTHVLESKEVQKKLTEVAKEAVTLQCKIILIRWLCR
jgi:hypothetical protein